jgi:hypothetical protein
LDFKGDDLIAMSIMMVGGLVCTLMGIVLILITRHKMFDRKAVESGKADYKLMYWLGIILLIAGVATQALIVLLE